MTDCQPAGLEPLLDRLDQLISGAYFVPLGLGDALALRLRAPTLNGLPLTTIRQVLELMDEILAVQSPVDSDPQAAMTAFFTALNQRFPEVSARWSQVDPTLWLDPVGAFQLVLIQAQDAIDAWSTAGPAPADARDQYLDCSSSLRTLMDNFDPERFPDDRSWRAWLRTTALASYPAALRPNLYLEAWAEFVRAVLDLDPGPDTRARWPY